MKTPEKLKAFKVEVQSIGRKLHELTDKVLAQVSGGISNGEAALDKYLKHITSDKSEILVDKGEGKKLSLDSTVKIEGDNNLHIIKRRQ